MTLRRRSNSNNGFFFFFCVASVTRSYKADDEWNNETLYVLLAVRVIAVLEEAQQRMHEQLQTDYEASREEAA